MTRIDIKMMHSTELRELRSMIKEELDFRAEIGNEITTSRKKHTQLKFELHGPGPDEER